MLRVVVVIAVLSAGACGGQPPRQGQHPEGQAALAATASGSDPRAELFVRKGCPQCHSISALGVKSPAEVGPDLTLAYQDVRTRFGVKLDEFLANPTGTMQVVLSAQITLTPAERDSIYHILKRLAEEREEHAER
ncbi:MAG TPA: hypothetical protein VNI61_04075 [Gemmatimonadales bacterium]|nr:hypothetical protein [Gemmatimonadales bacterium]